MPRPRVHASVTRVRGMRGKAFSAARCRATVATVEVTLTSERPQAPTEAGRARAASCVHYFSKSFKCSSAS
jgi:hypothetical protein